MAVITATSQLPRAKRSRWSRELNYYPTGAKRAWFLGLVVLATVAVYYQTYIGGAVGIQILGGLNISFLYFAIVIAVSNAVGALSSLASGVADKVGRANLVVAGLIGSSLVTLFWIPNTHSGLAFGVATAVAGFMEGVILVATPALIRDFSPQVGRAQAMGFWTMGPVIGSLIVTEVTSHTLNSLPRWQDQYVIAGIAGLCVCAIAFVGMRELDSANRDRIVGALEAETEAALAARGMTREQALKNPMRQMLKPDIVLSSVAISVFLLMYYTAVGFLPVFFQTVEGFTSSQANSLLNWLWGSTAASMLIFGILSDKLRVRKPFMLVGGLLSVLIEVAFLLKIDNGDPSYSSIATLLVFMGIWSGAAYVPWMASFTETVERRNPALSATGLAVWGWILRCVVAAAFVAVPLIASSATTLVHDGPAAQASLAQLTNDYPLLAAEAQAHPEVFAQLASYPADAIPQSVQNNAIITVGAPTLQLLSTDTKAQAELAALGTPTVAKVQAAQADTGHQWKIWFWICALGALVFCPMTFLMAGAWRPRPQHDAHAVEHALARANATHDDLDGAPVAAGAGRHA